MYIRIKTQHAILGVMGSVEHKGSRGVAENSLVHVAIGVVVLRGIIVVK